MQMALKSDIHRCVKCSSKEEVGSVLIGYVSFRICYDCLNLWNRLVPALPEFTWYQAASLVYNHFSNGGVSIAMTDPFAFMQDFQRKAFAYTLRFELWLKE